MQGRAKTSRTTHSKIMSKCREEIYGGREGRGDSLHISLCLHNSVSCIGILSLSDCNESPV